MLGIFKSKKEEVAANTESAAASKLGKQLAAEVGKALDEGTEAYLPARLDAVTGNFLGVWFDRLAAICAAPTAERQALARSEWSTLTANVGKLREQLHGEAREALASQLALVASLGNEARVSRQVDSRIDARIASGILLLIDRAMEALLDVVVDLDPTAMSPSLLDRFPEVRAVPLPPVKLMPVHAHALLRYAAVMTASTTADCGDNVFEEHTALARDLAMRITRYSLDSTPRFTESDVDYVDAVASGLLRSAMILVDADRLTWDATRDALGRLTMSNILAEARRALRPLV